MEVPASRHGAAPRVLLDSCIWIKERALTSGVGALARFHLRTAGAVLVLPEVVRIEVHRGLVEDLGGRAEAMRRGHRELLAVFGQLPAVAPPTDVEIRERVDALFDGLGVTVESPETTPELLRMAFERDVHHRPPGLGSGFADCLIWEHCLALAAQGDVRFVTEDSHFYDSKAKGAGGGGRREVHPELEAEASGRPFPLSVISDLRELLEGVRREVQMDPRGLLGAYLSQHGDALAARLSWDGLRPGELHDSRMTAYATEDPGRLFVEFTLLFDCSPMGASPAAPAHVEASGGARLDPVTGTWEDVKLGQEEVTWWDDGGAHRSGRQYLYAEMGSPPDRHRLREPLDGD